jgi:hypothetical protein
VRFEWLESQAMEKETENEQHSCKVAGLQPAPLKERSRLMQLLREEFPGGNGVDEDEHRVILLVRQSDYERLGDLIGRLQLFIESRMPFRKEHLHIVIRDQDCERENVFKFWNDGDN